MSREKLKTKMDGQSSISKNWEEILLNAKTFGTELRNSIKYDTFST